MEDKRIKLWVSLLVLSLILVYSLFGNAGSLEPSGAPGPTMKTLDEVEPRIAIHTADLPLTITEPNSYYLVEDVNYTNTVNHAITVECNDVTIDLMGYTLKGPDSGNRSGVWMSGRSNVEIRNGTIRDFGYIGIYESSSVGNGHRIINIRSTSNSSGIYLQGFGHLVKDCSISNNTYMGLRVNYDSTVTGNICCYNGTVGIGVSGGGTITGNSSSYNGQEGISILESGTVAGNTCCNNGEHGIYAGSGSTVTENTVYDNNNTGIYASSGSTMTGNTARGNYGDGIKVTYQCKVIDNTCHNNGNGGDGAGIHAVYVYNRIERNNVTSNDRGIDVDAGDNLIVKNSAGGNTTEYDIVGGNKVGTISTDPTTARPWDNFDL